MEYTPPKVDGTTGHVPTTVEQLNAVRNFAIREARKSRKDTVRVTANWLHQYPSEVMFDKTGWLLDTGGTDLSYEQEVRETEEIYGLTHKKEKK